jgi:thiamine pyrophosphokinase
MASMSTFAVLLGGDLTPTLRLKSQVAGVRVIAADGGIAHAESLDLLPELWVGDFDSAGAELKAKYCNVPQHIFPAEKDASDGDIAISEALRRGATAIMLVGGFGGQFDHALTNVAMLLALAKREIPCMMTSGHEEAHPLAFEVYINGVEPGTRLSVVPMSDVKGLTLRGVKWPLEHKNVPFGATLTLSNVVTGDVTVECDLGSGLVIVYPQ